MARVSAAKIEKKFFGRCRESRRSEWCRAHGLRPKQCQANGKEMDGTREFTATEWFESRLETVSKKVV